MAKPRVLVLNIVGLTPSLLESAPRLKDLANRGFLATMDGVLPAVTCTAQATMLTGALPAVHGIVGNGWYFRDLAEVWFWRQSNHLVGGSNLLQELRDQHPDRPTAKLFWWYNMYSAASFSVTPRPEYPADGRKIPGVYSQPPELGRTLQEKFGTFPLFNFWGPTASLKSSQWIADTSCEVLRQSKPDLALVYLPHLDYDLQRYGPNHSTIPEQVRAIDAEAGKLLDVAGDLEYEVVVLSEYGITEVDSAIELNRVLRTAGFLQVQETSHGELLDAGASRAFAVCDHQVAHVYVNDPRCLDQVQQLLKKCEGVALVLDAKGKEKYGLNHERSGEFVVVSDRNLSFGYQYWLDDQQAPDFARTVDIHRKPGYDPSELFFDPDRPLVKLSLMTNLVRKKMGFRTLMSAISMRSDLAKGSHGRLPDSVEDAPVFLCSSKQNAADKVAMTSVKDRLRQLLNLTGE